MDKTTEEELKNDFNYCYFVIIKSNYYVDASLKDYVGYICFFVKKLNAMKVVDLALGYEINPGIKTITVTIRSKEEACAVVALGGVGHYFEAGAAWHHRHGIYSYQMIGDVTKIGSELTELESKINEVVPNGEGIRKLSITYIEVPCVVH